MPAPLPQPLPAEVQQALQRGDALAAAQHLQRRTGMSPPGRPKGSYRRAQPEGTPVSVPDALAARQQLAAAPAGPPTLDELVRRMRRALVPPRRPIRPARRANDGGTAHARARRASRSEPPLAPGEVPPESNTVWLLVVLALLAWLVLRLLGRA